MQLSMPRLDWLPPHHRHPCRTAGFHCRSARPLCCTTTCTPAALFCGSLTTPQLDQCAAYALQVHAHKAVLLQFDYRERAHAVGKMPRSRTQKEFSHSDREVAVSALMDRAFKPLFPPGFSRFCQVRPGSALLPAQLGRCPSFLAPEAASKAAPACSCPGPAAVSRPIGRSALRNLACKAVSPPGYSRFCWAGPASCFCLCLLQATAASSGHLAASSR